MVVQIGVGKDHAGDAVGQRNLPGGSDSAGREVRKVLARSVAVRRQTQLRAGAGVNRRKVLIVFVPEQRRRARVLVMWGDERGGKLRPLEFAPFDDRVGVDFAGVEVDELGFVHVRRQQQRLAGVESGKVDDHPRAAVDNLRADDLKAVVRDNQQRIGRERAQAAGRGVEKGVTRGEPVAVLVAVDHDLR